MGVIDTMTVKIDLEFTDEVVAKMRKIAREELQKMLRQYLEATTSLGTLIK